jgi:long-subunit acyl-CoA synthetase (AMP-forming)
VDERTIPLLWRSAISAGRATPAYLVEAADGWQEVSWNEAARAVEELANGLLARGIRKGDALGIVARTRLEWTLFDFALAHVGAISAPVYPNASAREAQYVLGHSDAVGALVEDDEQRAKVLPLGLEHLLSFGDLDDVRDDGRAYAAAHRSTAMTSTPTSTRPGRPARRRAA